jgi:UDP-glucose 4-epimerase
MSVLVTGGAGYIGSVTVELLRERGEEVVVLDNLIRGHREAVDPGVPFYEGDVGDPALVASCIRNHAVDCCIHLAALAYVGESVTEPTRYFENNVTQGIRFLHALTDACVGRTVFSSSCATYGEAITLPISEAHPQKPTNPYGWTKLAMEQILSELDRKRGLRYVALRYFNAAGATASHGEDHRPETHLIPNILAAASGARPAVDVYGHTYPTPDGTAIRDYVHVADIAAAHLQALEYLRSGGCSDHLNLGTGRGYSVTEVLEAARRVTGRTIHIRTHPPRSGDPPTLFASSVKAQGILGWQPAFTNLDTIIESAWHWHRSRPQGYAAGPSRTGG